MDLILADKVSGFNAFKFLQLLPYICADKIDPKIFLPLFENDKERIAEVFRLMEKYSMITKVDKENFYQTHRLIQAVIKVKYNKDMDEKNIKMVSVLIDLATNLDHHS